MRIVLLVLFVSIFLGASGIDPIEVKHNWAKKKIEAVKNILESSKKEYRIGIITLEELSSWNKKLFMHKKEKLNIEYTYKVQKNPKLKSIDFTEDLNYVSSLLLINIERIHLYEEFVPLVKEGMDLGMMNEKDFEIFKFNTLEAYAEYDYVLALYKKHTKTRIPYKLPSNIVEELNGF